MSNSRSPSTPAPRKCRPSGPRCRAGASSLLRLTQPTAARLPTAFDLGGWVSRAAGMLGAMAPRGEHFAASTFGG